MNSHNFDNNCDNVERKVRACNKNLRYIFVQGATGPTGPQGEAGIQGLAGEIGPTGPKGDIGPIGPKGEDGGATIEVGITETVDADTEALVTNVGTNKDVVLNFKIPRGSPGVEEKIGPAGPAGEKGEQGEPGPKGDKGEPGLSEDLYNSLVFVDFPENTVAGIVTTGNSKKVPDTNDYFTINNNRNISLLKEGVYEITLCGKISGVTSTVGASFYLYDATNNKKIDNFSFELKKGNTPEMFFSKVNILETTTPIELQLKTEIENNASSDITFSDMGILIKKHNI